jgi:hypothetical protein
MFGAKKLRSVQNLPQGHRPPLVEWRLQAA